MPSIHTNIPGFNVRIAEKWLENRRKQIEIVCLTFYSMLCKYAGFTKNYDGTLSLPNRGMNFISILPDFKLDYWGRRFGLQINLLYVEDMNKGIGKEIMGLVCERLDIEQIEMFICVSPFSINPESDLPFHIDVKPRENAPNKSALISWYQRRFDFAVFPSIVGREYGYTSESVWMRRRPKQEIETE